MSELPNGPRPTLETYELVARACRYNPRRSAIVLQRMKNAGVKPTAAIYSRIVQASAASDPDQAFSMYQRMVAAQLVPTFMAFRALSEAAQKQGDAENYKSKCGVCVCFVHYVLNLVLCHVLIYLL